MTVFTIEILKILRDSNNKSEVFWINKYKNYDKSSDYYTKSFNTLFDLINCFCLDTESELFAQQMKGKGTLENQENNNRLSNYRTNELSIASTASTVSNQQNNKYPNHNNAKGIFKL